MIITLLIKSYLYIFLSIGLGALLILLTGFYFIFKSLRTEAKPQSNSLQEHDNITERQRIIITSHDINAIAGEDAIATQLDLARAYIETGRQQLAKNILTYVVKQGSAVQQREAQRWLDNI